MVVVSAKIEAAGRGLVPYSVSSTMGRWMFEERWVQNAVVREHSSRASELLQGRKRMWCLIYCTSFLPLLILLIYDSNHNDNDNNKQTIPSGQTRFAKICTLQPVDHLCPVCRVRPATAGQLQSLDRLTIQSPLLSLPYPRRPRYSGYTAPSRHTSLALHSTRRTVLLANDCATPTPTNCPPPRRIPPTTYPGRGPPPSNSHHARPPSTTTARSARAPSTAPPARSRAHPDCRSFNTQHDHHSRHST
jgi:hypothetical protein